MRVKRVGFFSVWVLIMTAWNDKLAVSVER
jgi:hypothetical protein